MSAALERRYRRVLRLLPAGYRQAWEEDMVSAYLQSASEAGEDGPSLRERLSVVVLAVRLRLTGTHASPRTLVWLRAVHVFALVALLYQALAATVDAARMVMMLWGPVVYPQDALGHLVAWGRPTVWLLWIVAFIYVALGRLGMARMIVLLIAAEATVLTSALSIIDPSYAASLVAPNLGNVAQVAWFAVSVLSVLALPRGRAEAGTPSGRRSSVLWLGALLVGALILVTRELHYWLATPGLFELYVNLPTATHVGLLAGMVIALGWAATRGPNPSWLLALAALGGAEATLHLVDQWNNDGLGPIVGFSTSLPMSRLEVDGVVATLAVTCACVGVFALRRMPRPSGGLLPNRT